MVPVASSKRTTSRCLGEPAATILISLTVPLSCMLARSGVISSDGIKTRSVNVTERIMANEVTVRNDIQAFLKFFGPFWAHPLQKLYVRIPNGSHGNTNIAISYVYL